MIDEDQLRARQRGAKMVGREADFTAGGRADPALAAEVAAMRKELAELRGLLAKSGIAGATAAPAAKTGGHGH
jgi:hypothetical protein